MRFNGDGTCLIENCNERYRCDCFGYEICRRATCNNYTTAANIIPSKPEPFKCQLTPSASICTDFTTFIDTVSGADNAHAEASVNADEPIEEEMGLSKSIASTMQIKVVVHDILNKMEHVADHIPDEDLEDLEKDVQIVLEAAQQANAESILCTKQSEETFKASRQASKFKRAARRPEKEATQKVKQKKEEEDKPKSKKNCPTCESLTADITRLGKERKEAAIAAGKWAKRARDHNKNAKNSRRKVKDIQSTAEEAREGCISKSQKLLTKLQASP